MFLTLLESILLKNREALGVGGDGMAVNKIFHSELTPEFKTKLYPRTFNIQNNCLKYKLLILTNMLRTIYAHIVTFSLLREKPA